MNRDPDNRKEIYEEELHSLGMEFSQWVGRGAIEVVH